MLRTIAGIVVGYLIFAVPAFLLFPTTHHDPHAPASLTFEVEAIVWGIACALLAGYLGTVIAGRRDLHVACYVAAIMTAIAGWSLLASGYSWSPVSALVCMVPAAVAGGWLRVRQQN